MVRYLILNFAISFIAVSFPALSFAELYAIELLLHGQPFGGHCRVGWPSVEDSHVDHVEVVKVRIGGKEDGLHGVKMNMVGSAYKVSNHEGYNIWKVSLPYAGGDITIKVFDDRSVEFVSSRNAVTGLKFTKLTAPQG